MESVGRKQRKKIRELVSLALAKAGEAVPRSTVVAAASFTNAAPGAGAQVQAFDTPANFSGGGPVSHAFRVAATISTNGASAVDLTATLRLRVDGVPVTSPGPMGIGVGGHTDSDIGAVRLSWVFIFNSGLPSLHSFGIQSDIGGGNTHALPVQGASISVTPLY